MAELLALALAAVLGLGAAGATTQETPPPPDDDARAQIIEIG